PLPPAQCRRILGLAAPTRRPLCPPPRRATGLQRAPRSAARPQRSRRTAPGLAKLDRRDLLRAAAARARIGPHTGESPRDHPDTRARIPTGGGSIHGRTATLALLARDQRLPDRQPGWSAVADGCPSRPRQPLLLDHPLRSRRRARG